jgi:ABC-type oligopeptide transport system substrate-binding subunit
MNRRSFLRGAAWAATLTGLAACGGAVTPAAPAATTAPKPTDAPQATTAPAATEAATEAPKPTEAPQPTEAPKATEAPTTAERVLHLNSPSFYGDPGGGTDPGCSGGGHTIFANKLMFSSLTYFDAKMQPQPDCAESWTHNDDSSIWTFKLRKDLKWNNGTPITAKDFEWTIKRNASPDISCGGGIIYMLDAIKGVTDYAGKKNSDPNSVGVKALDDYTLQFTLNGPAGYFPIMVEYPTYAPLPQQPIKDFGKDTQWTQPEHVISNGPYKLVEWVRDQRMTYVPNEYWHGYANTKPGVDKIVVNMIKNQTTAVAAYETGELDVIEVPTGELDRINKDPELSKQMTTYADLLTQYLQIRPGTKPFDDIRVRHALAIAIDREAIAKVLNNSVTPAYQILAPGMLGHDDQLIPEMMYNPDNARKALADAGFPGGKGFPKFWINSNHTDDYQAMFEALASMYKDVLGIEMELALLDPAARGAWTDQKPYRPHLWRERWGMDFPDSHNTMNFMASKSKAKSEPHPEYNWHDAKFEEVITQAGREADSAKRAELYKQADRICCWENPIIIPIYYAIAHVMVKPRVQNVWVIPIDGTTYRNVTVTD